MRKLNSQDQNFFEQLNALTAFEVAQDVTLDQRVAEIVEQVKLHGDTALIKYTEQFDRRQINQASDLELSLDACKDAFASLSEQQKLALTTAAERIRRFHEKQKGEGWTYTEPDGTVLGQKITPLDRVGIYVPGGKAAYPSSVLMNAIPAKVAGVEEIIMVVPTPDGVNNPFVLAAAYVAGVNRVFTVGGAQAVAALAYGTKQIPAVDKIVGPGNAYVAAAKRRVFGVVGIDMVAGPSEILVIADGSTDPEWVAMDLFSQAEHDEIAQAILLCPDESYLKQVELALSRLIETMPRRDTIKASLSSRGAMILVKNLDEACTISNYIAPEHLELSVAQPEELLDKIKHAGAIFMGQYSSESLGDYCAGPNHVLPTGRTARFASPLGVYDFQKRSSIIHVSRQGAQSLGQIASQLAHGEGLTAHARSAEFRLEK
ncbi:MAG: histidinol dehydrogenase [Betaproteobacteria bacterium]|uniref:histidinol dehydrogenase n=1 Tax=Ferrovum sp. PN-J185 TaxID=1356306 RepID=UPI00082DD38D|nr:histidinol dehydrogenase [Betaproteobacteria bacterium]MDE2056639.1 histidinol dehydrogenase [Betaproteobacteria bacterium]